MSAALATRWPQVFGAAEIEFKTSAGRARMPLSECATADFIAECSPVRRFPSFVGQSNYPGWWWFSTTRQHVGYESWLERDHVMAMDADPAVTGVASQPFRFHWSDGKIHTPDYFVRTDDGLVRIVDVRIDDRITEADAATFERSAQACRSVGWAYQRVGALNEVLAANLRWLSGYRHPRVLRPGIAAALESVFVSARPLMAGARSVGDAVMVLPVLFHLLWHGHLSVDLVSGALTERTLVGPASA
ncbi:TnsA-like heteromeric transposase endonuclease subunit [Mycobacterium avium]|uniref:TnsA-like heteromeric transposase endonuclease subunit n=1 Tax=Mycobacterium avium TaxID=1764 RepID=UPI0009B86971|nr:TnsA-like heteromeric transposase endonuclease subunit [Mycobacterium avium]